MGSKRVADMTPEEREHARIIRRECQRRYRKAIAPGQHKAELAARRLRYHARLAAMAAMAPGDLIEFRKKNSARNKRDLGKLSEAQYRKKLASMRARYHKNWARATPEQKEKKRAYERRRSAARDRRLEVLASLFRASARLLTAAERRQA